MHRIDSFIEITDFNAPELDLYARLKEAQLLHYNEPGPGLFLAESPKEIERALNAAYLPISFLVEKKGLDSHSQSILLRCPDTPVYTADFSVLAQLTGYELTRGMLCAMERKPLPPAAQVLTDARRVVLLNEVVNPTNVGAIFRCAAALGMDAVLLTPGSSNPLYRRALRVSMGTVFQVPWTILDKKDAALAGGIPMLQGLGFKTLAMALTDTSVSLNDITISKTDKIAVIMGTEGDGLPHDTIVACDSSIQIPMAQGVDSLNVASAAAVAFWEIARQQDDSRN